jgi:hypothetical protein
MALQQTLHIKDINATDGNEEQFREGFHKRESLVQAINVTSAVYDTV